MKRTGLARKSSLKGRRTRDAECANCGSLFISYWNHAKWTAYCSRECYREHSHGGTLNLVPCRVCGAEHPPGPPSKPNITCGKPECVGEMKSRSKLGDRNPMRRPGVAERAHRPVRERRQKLEQGLTPPIGVCMRPSCDTRLTRPDAIYCSPGCHYADRSRRLSRREQVYHRCFVCGLVFAFSGNGQGKCCSLECSGTLGPRLAEAEVVAVVKLRGYRKHEFRDEVQGCRAPGCGRRAVHQHHVVYRQHVIREHGDQWHPDNALGLCVAHHGEAHGLTRVPLTCLRDPNYSFAVALLGAGRAFEYLRRRYAGDDPRLDALLAQYEAAA